MRFLRSESYKKGIAASIALNVAAKGIGFVNTMAVAFYFGAQARTDIYYYCYATIALLVTFISSLDYSVIIPEAMRIREQEDAEKAKSFFNFFLYLYLFAGAAATIVLLADPVSILTRISNFDRGILAQNQHLVLWFVPVCMLMLIAQYITNILTSYRFFTVPVIAAIINSMFSIIFLLIFHKTLDVRSIVLGLMAGYLVNIVILVIIMKRQLNWRFDFKRIVFTAAIKRNIGYAFLGNLTSFFSGYAPFYIMSNFSAGVVTTFNYAKNLADIPNQMVTTQFSSVAGVKFNEQSARNDHEGLNRSFIEATGLLIFIMLPVCSILLLFSEQIVSLFYKRGAFDADAVGRTALMLKFFSFTLVYAVINTMVSRLFMATQKLKEAFWYQIYMNIVFIAMIAIGSYWIGVNGYLIANLAYQVIVIAGTYWLMRKYFPYIIYSAILKSIVINILLNAALIIIFGFIANCLPSNLFIMIALIGLYFVSIGALNYWLRVNEPGRSFVNAIFRKMPFGKAALK